jgi:hypothetical protein
VGQAVNFHYFLKLSTGNMEDQQLNETDRCAAPSDGTKCHGVEESSERWASRSRGSPLALVSNK